MIACDVCLRPALVNVGGHGDRCARHARAMYEGAIKCLDLRMPEGDSSAPRAVVSLVRLTRQALHDHLVIWNRSYCSNPQGITVQPGDGFTVAVRLLGMARGGE